MLGLHLAQHGTEARIRILLDDLLGAAHTNTLESLQDNQTKETILVSCEFRCFDASWWNLIGDIYYIQGIDKHNILLKVLDHLKNVPKWQRIFMEYTDQLNDINIYFNRTPDDNGNK